MVSINGDRPWRFFHVTHSRRVSSILNLGLKTRYDRRNHGRIWVCTESRLGWACQHVCETHGWQHDDLSVLGVVVPLRDLIRRRRGIYYSTTDIPSAMTFLAYHHG